jgi:hypothetical protein
VRIVQQAAPGEMLGRRGGEGELAARQRVLLPPVELDDLPRVDAEALQVGAHAQGGDHRHPAPRQLPQAGGAEVIVVIVGEQHRVQGRKIRDGRRGPVEAPGPREGHRRRPLAEDRVRQDALAVDLQEHRAVAEPGDPQARRGRHGPGRPGVLHGERLRRTPLPAAKKELAQHRQRVPLQPCPQAARVVEEPIAVVPGCAGPFEPKSPEECHGNEVDNGPLRCRHRRMLRSVWPRGGPRQEGP